MVAFSVHESADSTYGVAHVLLIFGSLNRHVARTDFALNPHAIKRDGLLLLLFLISFK